MRGNSHVRFLEELTALLRSGLLDANKLRVRGATKVACHPIFGVLVLAADQLMQLVT
ncbi:MAG: hypothetical protein ACKVOH_02245 [Chlamydiales bacterium]